MAIEHKCKITVLECKCFNDYQEKYLANPKSGPCPFFKPGDTFLLERNGKRDDFYHTLDGKFLLRGMGCHQPLCLYCVARRKHQAWGGMKEWHYKTMHKKNQVWCASDIHPASRSCRLNCV